MASQFKQVKCINDQGKIRYFVPKIANNTELLRSFGWEVVKESKIPELEPLIKDEIEPSKEEDSYIDLSVFDGLNAKKTEELLETGKYDSVLQDLFEIESNGEDRKGVKALIEKRGKNKQQ